MAHSGFIRAHQSQVSFLHRACDALLIVGAMWLSAFALRETLDPNSSWVAVCSAVIFLLVAESLSLYRSWRLANLGELLATTGMSWALVVGTISTAIYVLDGYFAPGRTVFMLWFICSGVALCSWRVIYRQFLVTIRRAGFNSRKAAIIGLNDTGLALADAIEGNPEQGINLIGIYDERSQNRLGDARERLAGSVDDVIAAARDNEVDIICIAMPLRAEQRTLALLERCRDTTVDVHIVPDLLIYQMLHSRWHNIGGIQTLNVCDTSLNGISGWLKRLEDLVLSSIILSLIALPMALIAIGVKLSSPGPVFFKQDRYGMDGSRIKVWKFRSMRTMENGAKVTQVTKGDPRITAFGSFLRKTSLDELPQFINVLQGTMSIVGPRPHAVAHNEEYRALISGYMLRHKVKPGITGWAQINGWRGETDTLDKMQKRVEFDLAYIRNWSLWLDLRIVYLTVIKGFVGANAY